MHGKICEVILARIRPDGTENKQAQISQSDASSAHGSSLEPTKENPKEPQAVWQQFDQFNSMTYRERQDFLDGPELPSLPLQQTPQQIPQQIPTRNRGRGGIQTLGGRHPRGYISLGKSETPPRDSDDSTPHQPTPYLRIKPVDEKMIAHEKDNYMKRLGNPRSLLYQYWTKKQNNKIKGVRRKGFNEHLSPGEQKNKGRSF